MKRVELFAFEGCPNVDVALQRVHAAVLAANVKAHITVTRIRNDEEAARLRFLGSPTVRVEGIDVEPAAAMRYDFGMQCRVYLVDGGFDGAPPIHWIEAAVGSPGMQPGPPSSSAREDDAADSCCSHCSQRPRDRQP